MSKTVFQLDVLWIKWSEKTLWVETVFTCVPTRKSLIFRTSDRLGSHARHTSVELCVPKVGGPVCSAVRTMSTSAAATRSGRFHGGHVCDTSEASKEVWSGRGSVAYQGIGDLKLYTPRLGPPSPSTVGLPSGQPPCGGLEEMALTYCTLTLRVWV